MNWNANEPHTVEKKSGLLEGWTRDAGFSMLYVLLHHYGRVLILFLLFQVIALEFASTVPLNLQSLP